MTQEVQQQKTIKCPKCQGDMEMVAPPLPPQILNGEAMSAIVMVNGHLECKECWSKYYTAIAAIQLQLTIMPVKEKEEPNRIVVPSVIPPKMNLIKK